MRLRNTRGFSLLEMVIVIAIGLIMATVTMTALMPLFNKNHVDSGYDMLLSTFRTYRNRAIAEGGRYILVPTNPNIIQVYGWGYVPPPGTSPAPVLVGTVTLPQDIAFTTWSVFPSPGPDGFPGGPSPISFVNQQSNTADTCSVVEAGVPCVVFYPDGSAQDDAGNYIGGVIYMTQPTTNAYSSRAIDIWGTTGRIRGWRLYNQSGANTWVQQ